MKPPRIDALTGVRIIAAAGVFLSHTSAHEAVPGVVRTFMGSGYNGVTLFFILSGFVLTWNYSSQDFTSRETLWSFFVARIARVYPLYLFALFAVALPQYVANEPEPALLVHILGLQAWSSSLGITYGFNGPAWSISVEFFLYACFPLVLFGLNRIRHSPSKLVLVGTVCIAIAFALAWFFTVTGRADLSNGDPESAHRWLYRMPLMRLGDFTLGAVAALLTMRAPASASLCRGAQFAGVASFVVLMSSDVLYFSAWSWDAAYMVPAFLLLWRLAGAPRTVFARVLASKPFVLAGEASFAFYLLHVTLMRQISFPGANGLWAWVALTVLEFVLILFASVGAHIVIERPAQRWLRNVADRRRRHVDKSGTFPEGKLEATRSQ